MYSVSFKFVFTLFSLTPWIWRSRWFIANASECIPLLAVIYLVPTLGIIDPLPRALGAIPLVPKLVFVCSPHRHDISRSSQWSNCSSTSHNLSYFTIPIVPCNCTIPLVPRLIVLWMWWLLCVGRMVEVLVISLCWLLVDVMVFFVV